MYTLASLVGFMALAVPAGDEKMPLPDAAPPTIQVVSAVDADKGSVVFLRVQTVRVPVQITEIVNVGGQQVPVTKTVVRDEVRTSYITQTLQNVQIQTASGVKLDMADALKRIKPGMALVISSDGKSVSPAYLSIVQPETIVLVPSPASAVAPVFRPLPVPK